MKKQNTLYDHETGSRLFTAKEAAEYLNYHLYSIYRLAMQGELRAQRKAGRTLLFMREELDRFRASNAWAARKASIEMPQKTPPRPPSNLKASVHVDLGLPVLLHEEEVVSHFTWEQIPLIHARIQDKYGRRPQEIRIQGPEGGLWLVSYEPPTLFDKLKTKLKKQFPRLKKD